MAKIKNIIFFFLALFSISLTAKASEITEQVFVNDVIDSESVIIITAHDGSYSVEYGVGCLSMWRYEEEYIYLARGGAFIDGIGDEIILPDEDGDCSIWGATQIDFSSADSISPGNIFTDIPYNHPLYVPLFSLKEKGIITGYPDGSFQPLKTINRGELMKILVGSLITPDNTYSNCFSDVKNEWFAPYICYGKERGWVEGYEGNVFKAEQTVSSMEAIKMLLEVYNVPLNENFTENPFPSIPKDAWFAKYIQTAKDHNLFSLNIIDLYPDGEMDRGRISLMLYQLIIEGY